MDWTKHIASVETVSHGANIVPVYPFWERKELLFSRVEKQKVSWTNLFPTSSSLPFQRKSSRASNNLSAFCVLSETDGHDSWTAKAAHLGREGEKERGLIKVRRRLCPFGPHTGRRTMSLGVVYVTRSFVWRGVGGGSRVGCDSLYRRTSVSE